MVFSFLSGFSPELFFISLRFLRTEHAPAAGSELKTLSIVFSLRLELARKMMAVLAAAFSYNWW